jgi:hypothetical protein
MLQNETPLARFFHNFERLNAGDDIPAQVAQFADMFIAANPQGAQCIRAEDFARALPKRIQLVQSLGGQSTSLVSVSETKLDERFAMAETRWRMTFRREGAPAREALADSLYILDMGGETPKIVFYLAHQEFMAMLKSNGILAC